MAHVGQGFPKRFTAWMLILGFCTLQVFGKIAGNFTLKDSKDWDYLKACVSCAMRHGKTRCIAVDESGPAEFRMVRMLGFCSLSCTAAFVWPLFADKLAMPTAGEAGYGHLSLAQLRHSNAGCCRGGKQSGSGAQA